jgi:hypothetical protein
VAMVVQVRHQVKPHHKHLHTCRQLGMHLSSILILVLV